MRLRLLTSVSFHRTELLLQSAITYPRCVVCGCSRSRAATARTVHSSNGTSASLSRRKTQLLSAVWEHAGQQASIRLIFFSSDSASRVRLLRSISEHSSSFPSSAPLLFSLMASFVSFAPQYHFVGVGRLALGLACLAAGVVSAAGAWPHVIQLDQFDKTKRRSVDILNDENGAAVRCLRCSDGSTLCRAGTNRSAASSRGKDKPKL
jgi:hypothetical protein